VSDIYQTQGRGQLYGDITRTVGDTPCVKLNRIAPDHVEVYVKVESFNPLGSVKDRLALNIIEAAERSGQLKPGQTVVEATSGNTGIGLAMVCAARGYPLVITMADSFSIERRRLMRFLGAKVVLTPKAEKGIGMYRKARQLAADNGWFFAAQLNRTPMRIFMRRQQAPRSWLILPIHDLIIGSRVMALAGRFQASRGYFAKSGPNAKSFFPSPIPRP